ncbi:helix-turn-helix transcriptional regulator [Myceligenerans crystallogenes]|uniref:LuxR family transcriptional regulator n=1 Tax=Myceligenerans crystallogenes TaxID=316335 RepID=A0ABN2NA80_9MICO
MPVTHARLVGRAAELAALRDALARAGRGPGRTVVVAGEAGIGKTRLVEELTGAADGVVVLTGQCTDSGSGPVPYAALTGILYGIVAERGAAATLAAAGPAAGALSAVAPGLVEADGDPGAERVPEVIAGLLARLAADRPVLVVLEDLHWSDDVTRALAIRLARTAPPGLLLVLTYRSDDVGRGHPLRAAMAELDRARVATRLDLRRLDQDEVRAMAGDLLAGDDATPGAQPRLPARFLSDLVERSEGVPFYVEELAGGLDGAELPESLRDILLLRYWRLSRPAQALCRVVAAAGASVWHDVLDDVLARSGPEAPGRDDPLSPDDAAREAIESSVLVATAERYQFRHALMQEAVYAELLPGERRRLHIAYANALTTALSRRTPSVAKLSHIADHWWRAGVLDKALAAAVEAHTAAVAGAAISAAVRLGERALELWEQVPDARDVAGIEHHELLRVVADAVRQSLRTDRALALAYQALDEWPAGDVVGHARMLCDAALCAAHAGSPEGPALVDKALDLLAPGVDDAVRAEVLIRKARYLMLDGRSAEAIEAAGAGHETALRAGHRPLAAIGLNIRATARHGTGDPAAMAEFVAARDLAGSDWNALQRYYINGTDAFLLRGEWERALAETEEGLATARRAGASELSTSLISLNRAEALVGTGRWAEAADAFARSIPLAGSGTHLSPHAVHLQMQSTWLTLWQGEVARARAEAAARGAAWDRFGALEEQVRMRVAVLRAQLALLDDDAAAAYELVTAFLATSDRPPYLLEAVTVAARAAVAGSGIDAGIGARIDAGINPEADVDADVAPLREKLAACAHWPSYPVWAAAFAAELGEGPWEAVADHPRGPAHLYPYARFRAGQALLGAGDRPGARAALNAAAAEADRIGAGLISGWAADLLGRAGLAADDAAAQPGGAPRPAPDADQLTAREQQVLDLVAEGLTNGQIAGRLFISPKTASVHVSAILRKLGVASRTEAALRARG